MADDLIEAHVTAVFREFLGRDAGPTDVAAWMAGGSLRALIDAVLASEEYADRVTVRSAAQLTARTGPFLNSWIAGSEALHRPVGDVSPDGIAIVGSDGQLFLRGVGGQNLATHRGESPLASDWLERWRTLIAFRTDEARRCGCDLLSLIVPEKLAVYADRFPGELGGADGRPARRLVGEAALAVAYPADELRAARAGAETYARTDSLLTWHGNLELARQTLMALGIAADGLDELVPVRSPALIGGDLGAHFAPPVVELCAEYAPPSRAELAFDNWAVVSFAGGHIGARRVFRRPDAPDQRVAVLFGDGYGFGGVGHAGLSWFLAQHFRELHFLWIPFGWDAAYVQRVGAEVVVSAAAERLVGGVPREHVEVETLEGEVSGRGGAVGLARVFADVQAG